MKKTKKVMIGVIAMLGAAGCSNQDNLPPKPNDLECKNYKFSDRNRVWECDDRSSSSHGSSYYGGKRYSSAADLEKDPKYQQYKQSPEFKKGFGSGSKVSGS
ncbi:hypothetical protein ACFDTO_25320 [Microbacteriaceae bacterium 4G12]